MLVDLSSLVGIYTDLILWVIVKFFLLMTEMSVVIFGLAFGRFNTSVKSDRETRILPCRRTKYFTNSFTMFQKGHLDSRSSIRYVLIVTSTISLAYSLCQGSLEILAHDDNFHVNSTNHDNTILFGHGGVWFFCITSFIFAAVSARAIKKTRARNSCYVI